MAPFGPAYGFGLYVHWPYCARICPYCDFNVYAAKARDAGPLLAAIAADIRAHRAALPDHPALDSVFLGGGTPSLLSASQIGTILETARGTFGLKADAEITLEANPNDVLAGDLEGWRAAGVTRLSIGVQSLKADALAFLGRDHGPDEARRAVEAALGVFSSVSIDLIYARPGQGPEDWRAELGEALALGAPHLSLYELTIEERTAFGKRAARGDLVPMDEDSQADLYELTQAITAQAGLPAYEVSNHARAPGRRSRHNLIYWRGGDWIGVGPGAHGRLTVGGARFATEAARRPADYVAAAQTGAVAAREALTPQDAARELVTMGLRPAEGLDPRRLEALTGEALDAGALAELETQGLLTAAPDRVALTPAGRLLADRISALLSP